MFKEAREDIGFSQDKSSNMLNIHRRTLCIYEAEEHKTPANIVVAMSKIYEEPTLTQHYCKKYCTIGQAYSYEVLDLDIPTILLMLISSIKKAGEVLPELGEIMIGKTSRQDFTEEEWENFIFYFNALLDIEHSIESLKINANRFCNVSELIREHNEKCKKKMTPHT